VSDELTSLPQNPIAARFFAVGRYFAADWRAQSGPQVARVYHRFLALILLDAWISLAVQVRPLIGSRGLMPLDSFLHAARGQLSLHDFPTIFYWGASDGTLTALTWIGALLALCAVFGLAPRICFALSIPLYLSYATACRTFLSFQWDNLLLESLLLATLLPGNRRSWWPHLLLRLLLFKLYFESGIAKWQSPLHDWHDGSAMTYYYETAPLPTWLGWYAHHLPIGWHRFEAWATLVLELVVPFFIFATRPFRLAAAALLTGFQVVNAATANYGFFCWLAVALHVFLLDDRDAEWIVVFVRARLRRPTRSIPSRDGRLPAWLDHAMGGVALILFLFTSTAEGLLHFARSENLTDTIAPLARTWAPLRVINTYHLFASITRERIEPELQTMESDGTWKARDLRHKAGDPMRAPDFVAPHQPRLDFQLWFHGLGYRRGAPEYVGRWVDRVCRDPEAVQGFFREPLPTHPMAVRVAYYRYHFTTPDEKRATGAWWTRELIEATRAVSCAGPSVVSESEE
jgi:hypothetical protein